MLLIDNLHSAYCKYKYECHKLREIWKLENCKEVVFDTYPGVETYAELECESVEDIQRVLQKLDLDTNLDTYHRIIVNEYYRDMYGIERQSSSRLSFETAYDTLLRHSTKNQDLLKQRLDDVHERHKTQILELERQFS